MMPIRHWQNKESQGAEALDDHPAYEEKLGPVDRHRVRCLRGPIDGLVVLGAEAGPSRISVGTLDKIRPGMARAEVEELLGGPPGDYSRQ